MEMEHGRLHDTLWMQEAPSGGSIMRLVPCQMVTANTPDPDLHPPQEVKEFYTDVSRDVMSAPLEDNIFEWQFAIRGATDSDYEVTTHLHHDCVALGDVALHPTTRALHSNLQPSQPSNTRLSVTGALRSRNPKWRAWWERAWWE